MDKANIIISIIIVLCIAAAVAAYGITNSDSPIFSDLSSMSASSNDAGNGIGNSSSIDNGSGVSVATTSGSEDSNSGSSDQYSSSSSGSSDSPASSASSGSSEGSSSGSEGSGSSVDSGSSDSGSGSSDSGSSNSDGSDSDDSSDTDSPTASASTIKDDAWGHIGEDGYYPGNPYYSDSYWYVTVYDNNDSAVDSFQYTSDGSYLGRG